MIGARRFRLTGMRGTVLLAMVVAVGAAVTVGAALSTGADDTLRNDDDSLNGNHPRYTNRSLQGVWGFSSHLGMFLPPGGGSPLPIAGMGKISFDGRGGCSVVTVVNLNGQTVTSQSSSCIYSVGPDGMGTSQAVFPGSPISEPVPISFVIVDQGRELRAINTRFLVGGTTFRRQ
ncbi:hypothetical protein JY651_08025 [Pyxidicoccus parkwayensis]|uniref:Uncharacterized protein n=1 Tax=Pyxidicoccus parkwayensis TaxID=2813578 RepID=A0ABX7P341_9BACT|nr:hypothetical protein [Pyxidicoccus parkwaysis]QSQ24876.1 hypothetical protein JY651_08025 [Pyxidicoccus parkwaysis]